MTSITGGISSQYPFLHTARRDVDWRHVSPILLRQLNALGRELGKIIVIFSGYRSDRYSEKVGGFAGDPHTRHIAVDATIGGKPIGQVVSPRLFYKYSLRSGNQPNFYRGKRDPSHVDLVGTGIEKAATGTSAVAQQPTSTPTSNTMALPDFGGDVPFGPQLREPAANLPGTVPAGGSHLSPAQETWSLIASQPFASPETQDWAKSAG